ncbi:hypothetical protein RND81_02G074000 [Saponaria officinalis]|uniref:RRM domain-containing protein n=1 Tax=Saponaria officinalis TaxID=3572 RepID=A0AAW1MS98_SAPOF
MASSQQHRCVFVGNIPYDATEEQLVQICEEVGPVVSFRLVVDRETGKPKGYGFCEYKDEETALSARRNLQGYEINGRQLRVDFAENDKGSDRNRDQGRGGPGLVTNAEAPKQIGGPAVNVDAALHQPIGLQIAMTAASVMAGALGGSQISQMSQNVPQNQAPVGSDPLTHHLAKMSRSQLNQIVHEMKVLGTQNKDLARQILLASPQLPKALFQAQIMLGMVTPQMMPNIRQVAPSLATQPSSQVPMQSQLPVVQNIPGMPSFTPLTSMSQSSLALNQFSAPLPLPSQPRAQYPNLSQLGVQPQNALPVQSGPSSLLTARSQPPGGPQILPVSSSFRPSQALHQQQAGHAGMLAVQNANTQPSFQSRPMSSDPGYQVVSAIRPSVAETNIVNSKQPQTIGNSTLVNKTHTVSNLPQLSKRDNPQDPTVRPSKLVKLDTGRGAPFSSAGSAAPTTTAPGPSNAVGNNSIGVGKSPSVEAQNTEKQSSQLQLPPGVESALLQQVLSLTPEQLSSLPPDQQQQVIQLQQMLR